MKDIQSKYDVISKQLNEKVSKIDILELELSQVKHKVIESEYAAFCMTLTQEGLFSAEPQNVQLIMRKNCHGESILVFENPLGHMKTIKASQVLDVEPLLDDQRGFKIKYDGYFKNKEKSVEVFYTNNRYRVMKFLKNFLNMAADNAKNVNKKYPDSAIQRNLLNDLKSMFIC